MPIRSPGDVPGATVRDLGLPARTVTALTRAGITQVAELAALSRDDLAAIAGLGPGSVAAIRQVVPEPGADPERESPDAPAIPSFDSLRAPHRRSALDLLVPGDPPPAPPPVPPAPSAAPEPATPRPAAPRPAAPRPAAPRPAAPRPAAPRPAAPRPAEYADLWRFGVRVLRAGAVLPARMAWWSLREPVRLLHRLVRSGPASDVPGPRED